MLSAAIDVGSNTLRMLIGAIRANGINRIFASRAITRLAEGMRETGSLREANMEKSLSALKEFSRAMADYGVSRIRAVGTSALRDALNSAEFIDRALRESGVPIEVITGIREAELTAMGVTLGLRTAGPSLIIDIGGGSTEWILQERPSAEGVLCGTLPLGVVNLQESFIKSDPPSAEDMSELNKEISSHLGTGHWGATGHRPFDRLVGTGGTITTLAALDLGLREYEPEKVHLHKIGMDRLRRQGKRLMAMTLDERRRVSGLEPGRADLIIPGVLLTIKFMEISGLDEITVSDYGLLEGLIKEMHDEEGI